MRPITPGKQHEGKTIWGIPTGINRTPGIPDKEQTPVKFEVVRFHRKFVEMRKPGEYHADRYLPETGSTQSAAARYHQGFGGYIFFENETDPAQYFAHMEKVGALHLKLRGPALGRLTTDKIETMLGWFQEATA